MPDVLIRKCAVRVVRRGGWSWGPAPRDLVAAVLQALPALLAEQLERMVADDVSGIIDEPIAVRIPVRRAEFAQMDASGSAQSPLASAIADAVAEALREPLRLLRCEPASEPARDAPLRIEAAYAEPRARDGRFACFLAELAKTGALAAALERLPRETLAIWHSALFDRAREFSAWSAVQLLRDIPPELAGALDAMARAATYSNVPQSSRAAAEIALAAALAQRTGRLPNDDAVVRAVLCWRMADERAGESSEAVAAIAPPPLAAQPAAVAARPSAGRRATEIKTEAVPRAVRFSTALPWLALAPLERSGLLDAVGAQFEAARMLADLPVFAAAFAAKFLEPDEREAVAAFAGEHRLVPEEEINDLPRRCRDILPALWLALQAVLYKGRADGTPLALVRLDRGFGLADAGEALLFAVGGSVESLLPAIALIPGAAVATTLPPGDTALLSDMGVAVVRVSEDVDAVQENCAQFVDGRQSAPRAFDLTFEGFLAALAMAAVGALASGGTPLQGLEHFRRFDALAETGEEKIRVRMPLGRRYLNLERDGWLRPVRRVPWLEPRYVEFSGG